MDEPVRPQCDTVGIREVSVLAWARRVTLTYVVYTKGGGPGSIDRLSEAPGLGF